jgi:hypothetical protein
LQQEECFYAAPDFSQGIDVLDHTELAREISAVPRGAVCSGAQLPLDGFDTPHGLKPGGFSVLWGCLRHLSPTALPEPFSLLGGVVVPMETGSAVRAAMQADGRAFGDHDTTARTDLAG